MSTSSGSQPHGAHRRQPGLPDLDGPEQIGAFVTRFYRELAQDDRFHHYFETIAHVDWNVHVLDVTDFWVGVLDGGGQSDADEVIEAHRWLHDSTPFDTALFETWLDIFESTLHSGWAGELTDRALKRARGYAWAMSKRFTGDGLALDATPLDIPPLDTPPSNTERPSAGR